MVAVIISFVSVAWGLPWLSRDLSYLGSEPPKGGGEARLQSQSEHYIRHSTKIY